MPRRVPSLSVFVLLLVAGYSRPGTSKEEDQTVVARVDGSAITLAELESRLATLAPFQRRELGATPALQARRYLNDVLIPERLLEAEGARRKVGQGPRMRAIEQSLLRQALTFRILNTVEAQKPIGDEEVLAYYNAHPELFRRPAAIRLLRLLVDRKDEAKELIAKAKLLPSMDDWRNLVREKSVDKATKERGGDLGFVAEDGSTDVAELVVDKALFAAASKVSDGLVVDEPVVEGTRFAVVYRRGSRPASNLELSSESPKIRKYLLELRVENEMAYLTEQLRKAHLMDFRPQLLEGRDFSWIFERGFSPSTAPVTPESAPSSKGSTNNRPTTEAADKR